MVEKSEYLGSMRQGRINAGVFKNEYGYSFAISKNYRDKDDEWKETHFYNPSDLIVLRELVDGLINKFGISEKTTKATWTDPKKEGKKED